MEHLFHALAAVIVLGIAAQWVAWRIRVPAILLLLIMGFVAGPVTGFVDPDALFGDLLFPVVSLAVATILFEGGLNLELDELDDIGPGVLRLVTVGVLLTWSLTTAAAYYVLDLALPLAIRLGAILVVTGPPVIAECGMLGWPGSMLIRAASSKLIAISEDDEKNALAVADCAEAFGTSNVYQLTPEGYRGDNPDELSEEHLRGRSLFRDEVTYSSLEERFEAGAEVIATRLTEEYDFEALLERDGDPLPLFLIRDDTLEVFAGDDTLEPQPGDQIITVGHDPTLPGDAA